MRLLLVEDDARVAAFVARGLREQSYAVDLSTDGDDALYRLTLNDYDIVVLDVMLPRRDGYSVCKELRAAGSRAPVLMLTARDAVEDRVAGLDCGADDYLTKPFEFPELLARLRALLRRSGPPRTEILRAGSLALNTASHSVTRDGDPITLTAKEYALLEFLLLHKERVVGREQIAEHVWDENFDPFSNLIEVYIKRLRAKIDARRTERLIHTRRGEGYILSAAPGASVE